MALFAIGCGGGGSPRAAARIASISGGRVNGSMVVGGLVVGGW